MKLINYIDVGCINTLVRPWKNNIKHIKCALGFDPRSEKNSNFSKNFSKGTKVFRYECAIFNKEGVFPFYICNKGECSSLFEPDLYKYIHKSGVRSTNEEKNKRMEVVSTTKIECRRLDSVLNELEINFDFIKIDTQGADHQVIESLGEHLNNIIGIHTELNLQQFYKGITLFGETNKFLKKNGFCLAKVIDRKNSYWNNFLYLRKKTAKIEQMKLIKKIYRM